MRHALSVVRQDLNDDQFEEIDSYFTMAANQLRNV
jgi:hypothetical protein